MQNLLLHKSKFLPLTRPTRHIKILNNYKKLNNNFPSTVLHCVAQIRDSGTNQKIHICILLNSSDIVKLPLQPTHLFLWTPLRYFFFKQKQVPQNVFIWLLKKTKHSKKINMPASLCCSVCSGWMCQITISFHVFSERHSCLIYRLLITGWYLGVFSLQARLYFALCTVYSAGF